MILLSVIAGSLLAFAAKAAGEVVLTDHVPLLGPSFVSNFDPSNSSAMCSARTAVPEILGSMFSSGELNSTDLIISIDVFSAATNKSIYSYYHVGENGQKALTAGILDENTIMRIGSVTKLYTVYALVVKYGLDILNKPLTSVIPELVVTKNQLTNWLHDMSFNELTIGALSSHQGGTGGAADILLSVEDARDLNFDDVLDWMKHVREPVISPYESAIYSDGGFALLTLVLERLTGKTFNEALQEIIYDPLGITDTMFPAPEREDLNAIDRSVIDPTSGWGKDIPVVAGSGGLYASNADLRTVGLSILNSELLSPAETAAWMKPLAGTGSLVEMVGAPWEIARLTIPVAPGSERTRVSDLYMKIGGVGDYGTFLALSPDHGIGFTVQVAGSTAPTARFQVRDVVGEAFIPAAEFASLNNAKRNLEGTYFGAEEGTNMTLTVVEDGAGLGVETLYVEGLDARSMLLGEEPGIPLDITIRAYPTKLNSVSNSLATLYEPNFTGSIAHRLVAYPSVVAPRAAVEGGERGGLFDNSAAWMNIDMSGTADRLIFNFERGKLVSVKSAAVDRVFTRAE